MRVVQRGQRGDVAVDDQRHDGGHRHEQRQTCATSHHSLVTGRAICGRRGTGLEAVERRDVFFEDKTYILSDDRRAFERHSPSVWRVRRSVSQPPCSRSPDSFSRRSGRSSGLQGALCGLCAVHAVRPHLGVPPSPFGEWRPPAWDVSRPCARLSFLPCHAHRFAAPSFVCVFPPPRLLVLPHTP